MPRAYSRTLNTTKAIALQIILILDSYLSNTSQFELPDFAIVNQFGFKVLKLDTWFDYTVINNNEI